MDRIKAAKQLVDLLGLRMGSDRADIPGRLLRKMSSGSHPRRPQDALTGSTQPRVRSSTRKASAHFNCPIGAHTHGIDLPPAQEKELEGLVGTMTDLDYLLPEEVAIIPRREGAFGVAIYAPPR